MNKKVEGFFKKFASVCIITAAALWGIIGIFVRRLSAAGLGSLEIMLVRCVMSALMIFVYLALFDREKLKVRVCDLWMFLGTGVISFLTFGVAYFMTIQLTSMSVAAVLLYTSPVFVTLMAAVFFKEKITRIKVLALVAAVGGCVLVSGGFGTESIGVRAVAIGLVSGFCYALYSIFGRVAAKRYSPITVTAYTLLFAAVGSIFVADLGKTAQVMASDLTLIPFFTLFAFVSAVLPYILYTGGLKYTTAGKAAVIACIEPVVAALIGVLIFRETMSVQALCGAVLILGAVGLLNKQG